MLASYGDGWLAVVVGEGQVDGCWHRAETSRWMLAPYGDRWLAVVVGERPVDA